MSATYNMKTGEIKEDIPTASTGAGIYTEARLAEIATKNGFLLDECNSKFIKSIIRRAFAHRSYFGESLMGPVNRPQAFHLVMALNVLMTYLGTQSIEKIKKWAEKE